MHVESLHEHPAPAAGKCGRRCRSCRQCGYRWPAGDRSLTCPECATDRRCRRAPANGIAGGACRLHGGASLVGPASPSFKTGRWSRYLPADLAGRFAEHFNNPELLSLRDDIAMLRVRVGELLPQLDGEEAEQKAAWRELARLLTRISGLVMRESRMVARARMYLTLPEAQSLVVALSTAVRDEVTDPAALGRILTRFRALATRQHCIGIDAKPSTPTPAPSGACDHATL